ncbi:MAG: methylglyoxal synthase [Oceanospirillaceae bacterium]|nr:methylglyoxal synthase [Oceanospirillaceae bacterium]
MQAKVARQMRSSKTIALVAHDNMKDTLINWCKARQQQLSKHNLVATGTTGALLEKALGSEIKRYLSGPMGGDQQIGADISSANIDILVFFWDPLSPQPHDPDIKALLRLAAVWNIPVACTPSSADFMFSSPLIESDYEYLVPDYQSYLDSRV